MHTLIHSDWYVSAFVWHIGCVHNPNTSQETSIEKQNFLSQGGKFHIFIFFSIKSQMPQELQHFKFLDFWGKKSKTNDPSKENNFCYKTENLIDLKFPQTLQFFS